MKTSHADLYSIRAVRNHKQRKSLVPTSSARESAIHFLRRSIRCAPSRASHRPSPGDVRAVKTSRRRGSAIELRFLGNEIGGSTRTSSAHCAVD